MAGSPDSITFHYGPYCPPAQPCVYVEDVGFVVMDFDGTVHDLYAQVSVDASGDVVIDTPWEPYPPAP
jgi:hypothetical protein